MDLDRIKCFNEYKKPYIKRPHLVEKLKPYIGLRNSIIGFRMADISQILENIVFNHLVSLGYTVTIGSFNGYGIDFVAERQNEKRYIQVTYLMKDEKTIARETDTLLKIKVNYPKYIVSMDELPVSNVEGIIQMNIREFLTADVLKL